MKMAYQWQWRENNNNQCNNGVMAWAISRRKSMAKANG